MNASKDLSWRYHVGALRATCVKVCRCCGTLRERHAKSKDCERRARAASTEKVLTAGDARQLITTTTFNL